MTSIIKRTLDMIQAPIKRRQAIRIEKQKELDILFGEQDALDILSYAGLEENIDYLCVDGILILTTTLILAIIYMKLTLAQLYQSLIAKLPS